MATTRVTAIEPANPMQRAQLNAWVTRVRANSMNRIGALGPGLTNGTFNSGMANLTNSMEARTRATIDYHRAAGNKTFADKHGDTLAERIFHPCNAADELALPEVHHTLVNAPKARECAIVSALLAERAEATPLQSRQQTHPWQPQSSWTTSSASAPPEGLDSSSDEDSPPSPLSAKGTRKPPTPSDQSATQNSSRKACLLYTSDAADD